MEQPFFLTVTRNTLMPSGNLTGLVHDHNNNVFVAKN